MPGDQGGEDGVIDVEDGGGSDAGADAEHQAAAAVVEDVALRVLIAAVVTGVIATHGDRGQPQDLGLLQHGGRNTDAFRCRSQVCRLGVCKL